MDRISTRKYIGHEHMDRRLEDAELLLGDILVDKPQLPKEEPASKVKRKTSPKGRSPKRKSRSPKRSSTHTTPRKPYHFRSQIPQPRVADASPSLSQRSRHVEMQEEWRRSLSPESRKGILKTSDNYEERMRMREETLIFSDELEVDPDFDRTADSTEGQTFA